MARTAEDWLTLGFEILRTEGPHALTIEHLCRAASLTKGAFYHRFAGIDAYRDALLARWQELNTQSVVDAASREPDQASQQAVLRRLVLEIDLELERAIRSWALRDAAVQQIIDATDEHRIATVAAMAPARDDPEEALAAATLSYAMYLGFVMMRAPQAVARMAEWGPRVRVSFDEP